METVDSIRHESSLNLIDLAGSERAKKVGSVVAGSKLLQEAAKINRSLLALSSCIASLVRQQQSSSTSANVHTPFRDSKLTRLLKSSLVGNCRSLMIANVSPSSTQFEETRETLTYAANTRSIKRDPLLAPSLNPSQFSSGLSNARRGDLERIIASLRQEIAELRLGASLDSAGPGTARSRSLTRGRSMAVRPTTAPIGAAAARRPSASVARSGKALQDEFARLRAENAELRLRVRQLESEVQSLKAPIRRPPSSTRRHSRVPVPIRSRTPDQRAKTPPPARLLSAHSAVPALTIEIE